MTADTRPATLGDAETSSARWRRIGAEVVRFFVVAQAATWVSILLFNVLVHGFLVGRSFVEEPMIAYVLANCVGMVISFHGARGWVFPDRPPQQVSDGEVRDLGGHRVRTITTPHVPHGWEAQVLFDETTRTLLCGDLFTRVGDGPALVHDADMITPAMEAEDMFGATCLTPSTAPTPTRS